MMNDQEAWPAKAAGGLFAGGEAEYLLRLGKNDSYYKSLFTENHLVMLIIDPDTGKILDVNKAACGFYGYGIEELKKLNISDINTLPAEQLIGEMKKAGSPQRSPFDFRHRLADGQIRDVEVYSGFIRVFGKECLYSVIHDVTLKKEAEAQIRQYSQLLEGILRGIPDIIGVYKPDHSIIMYNQAGLDFYKKRAEEVVDKKCYEMLCRSEQCEICTTQRVLNTGGVVRFEKYVKELDKYMDCCGSPVFDENGNTVLIVEQLRDITEKKKTELALKRREEQYRNLVELSPDAVIVIYEGNIVLANKAAMELFRLDSESLCGSSYFSFIHPMYYEMAEKRINEMLQQRKQNLPKEYKMVLRDNSEIYVEIASTFFNYDGKPAVQSVIRNITERKKELDRASKIQRQLLDTEFPLKDKAVFEYIYKPAGAVSGDFFHIRRLSDRQLIGIIGDVSGKGVSAALGNSAMKVMFYEIVNSYDKPDAVLAGINAAINQYLGDNYVAACCFAIDFDSKTVEAAGAGINEFIFCEAEKCSKHIVKGPFLGMFKNSEFDMQTFSFECGDKLYFYTDGLDEILNSLYEKEECSGCDDVTAFRDKLENRMNGILEPDDDSTWIGIEFK